MNGSEGQTTKISSEYKNSEIALLNKDANKIEFTCMSCNKLVSDVQMHLKIDHNIDCYQIVNDQNENISLDLPQNDIKNETLYDYCEDVFDNVSLTELDGYLPASDYSILKEEGSMIFVCKSCNSNFDSFVDLKDHSIMQHNKLIQRRDCRHCHKMLDSHKNLMEHVKEHHSACKQLNKIQKILNQFKNNSETLKTKHFDQCYYSCSECSKTFRSKSSLILHQRKVHSMGKFSSKDGKLSFWCLECQLNFSEIKDLKRHQNDNHGEQTFVCLTCDTIFPSRGNLNLHNIYHHRLHWCSICNIAFPGRLAVTSHVKQKHPGMPVYRANSRFVCEYCSQSFSIRSQLSDHIQSIHLGFVNRCNDCGKILATSETLKVHRLKHQPEMHRTCEHCGRQFYRTGMLTEHIRACHPEALPEDWRLNTTCPYCQTSFTRRESMRRHIEAKHEPKNLSCSFCERLFTCRRYLVRHENKHHLQRRTAL